MTAKGRQTFDIQQFRPLFTIDKSSIPKTTKYTDWTIHELLITTKGLVKLFKNEIRLKASEPDTIPNRILKDSATKIAPGLTTIFQTLLKTRNLPED